MKVNQKGFTLIELLIYITISSVLLIGIYTFVVEILKVRNKVVAETIVEQNARFAFERMSNLIRESYDFTIIDSNTIQVKRSAAAGDYVTFDLDNGVVYSQEQGGDPIAITGNDVYVKDLIFDDRTTPNSSSIVRITLDALYPDITNTLESQAVIHFDTYVSKRSLN